MRCRKSNETKMHRRERVCIRAWQTHVRPGHCTTNPSKGHRRDPPSPPYGPSAAGSSNRWPNEFHRIGAQNPGVADRVSCVLSSSVRSDSGPACGRSRPLPPDRSSSPCGAAYTATERARCDANSPWEAVYGARWGRGSTPGDAKSVVAPGRARSILPTDSHAAVERFMAGLLRADRLWDGIWSIERPQRPRPAVEWYFWRYAHAGIRRNSLLPKPIPIRHEPPRASSAHLSRLCVRPLIRRANAPASFGPQPKGRPPPTESAAASRPACMPTTPTVICATPQVERDFVTYLLDR